MTAVVTGANGALGRMLSARLRAAGGEEVISAVRRPQGPNDVLCDVADRDSLIQMLTRIRPRRLFHLAAAYTGDFESDLKTNAMAALHMFECIGALALPTRVIVVGSAAEYGVVRTDDNPVREDRALHPVSAYGVTKAIQSQIAGWHAAAFGIDVVIARIFNLFAPGMSERLFVGRIEGLIGKYKRGEVEAIEVGNLDALRDYVDGAEAVRQLLLITSRGAAGGAYHVATGKAVVMRELLYKMLDAAGVPRSSVVENVNDAGRRVGYDIPVIYADISRTVALEASAA